MRPASRVRPRVVANPEAMDTTMADGGYLTREGVRKVYQRRARIYDPTIFLYYVAGMRIDRWRRLAVEALKLRRGDTVVEIGCGTGLNFEFLEAGVGPEGKIIGVDISEAMLERARRRMHARGWHNIELICSSAADYRFPQGVDGILSCGVLNFEPDFDAVIERGTEALAPGGSWAVLDYKKPEGPLRHLAPLFMALKHPFWVYLALVGRHPWKSVQRRLRNTEMREFYGGFAYIISGEAP